MWPVRPNSQKYRAARNTLFRPHILNPHQKCPRMVTRSRHRVRLMPHRWFKSDQAQISVQLHSSPRHPTSIQTSTTSLARFKLSSTTTQSRSSTDPYQTTRYIFRCQFITLPTDEWRRMKYRSRSVLVRSFKRKAFHYG